MTQTKRPLADSPEQPGSVRKRLLKKTSGWEGLAEHAHALVQANSEGNLEKKQICENILKPLLPVFQEWSQHRPPPSEFSGIMPLSADLYQKNMTSSKTCVCTVHFYDIGLVRAQEFL